MIEEWNNRWFKGNSIPSPKTKETAAYRGQWNYRSGRVTVHYYRNDQRKIIRDRRLKRTFLFSCKRWSKCLCQYASKSLGSSSIDLIITEKSALDSNITKIIIRRQRQWTFKKRHTCLSHPTLSLIVQAVSKGKRSSKTRGVVCYSESVSGVASGPLTYGKTLGDLARLRGKKYIFLSS